tara:strand:+ start:106 stop:312 length:207 start_codon:yes stop_codon:yes gene_type:complete
MKYKGFKIVPSDRVEGWFMTTCGLVVGESVEEVIFDIDDTQEAIDYDNEMEKIEFLRGAFEKYILNKR